MNKEEQGRKKFLFEGALGILGFMGAASVTWLSYVTLAVFAHDGKILVINNNEKHVKEKLSIIQGKVERIDTKLDKLKELIKKGE